MENALYALSAALDALDATRRETEAARAVFATAREKLNATPSRERPADIATRRAAERSRDEAAEALAEAEAQEREARNKARVAIREAEREIGPLAAKIEAGATADYEAACAALLDAARRLNAARAAVRGFDGLMALPAIPRPAGETITATIPIADPPPELAEFDRLRRRISAVFDH
jgi:hypothetical protein